MGLDPLWLYPVGLNYYDKYEALNAAFLGTIGNAGLLAAYLCLAAPLLTVFSVLSDKSADTWLLLPGALALGVLMLCDIDAGILADDMGLGKTLQVLADADIDVEYTYAFLTPRPGSACMIFRVADNDAAAKVLRDAGVTLATKAELA